MADTTLSMVTSALPARDEGASRSLALLKKGESGVVAFLRAAQSLEQASVRTRLLELGFSPGETLRVVAQSAFGGAPLAIRLGSSTFALRRHEAEMIELLPPA
jgi:ferrous iron transport protein A